MAIHIYSNLDVNRKHTGAYIERKNDEDNVQIRLNFFDDKWMSLKEAKDHLKALSKAIEWMENESE